MYQGINTAADKVIYAEQGMPIIQSKHFTSGRLTLADTKFIGAEDVQKYGHKYIPEVGDILFSNIGTVGKSVVVDENIDFMFAWNVFLIKLKSEKIFNLYLQYYLDYLLKRNAFEPWFTGGTVKFLNKKTIGNFNIPLPSLAEQQKIASILDAADSLRQKDQQLIEKYTALSQSLFLEMFGDPVSNPMGWSTDKFSNIAVNCDSVRIPIKQSEREKIQGEYPYYGATGIVDYVNDYIFDGEFLLIAEDGKNLVNRKKPLAWVVSGKFWVNNHSHIVKSNGSTNLTFLEFHFNNMDISNYVTGIDQFKMNKSNLDRIQIILPPITLQNQFAERIQSIEAQKQLALASLEKSEALFNSLLQRAFKGELTT